jgi:hypothetical protein
MTDKRKRLAVALHEAILSVCAEHEFPIDRKFVTVSLWTRDEAYTEGGRDHRHPNGQLNFRAANETFRTRDDRSIDFTIFYDYDPSQTDDAPEESTGQKPF